jgi:hypothetical protein
MQVRKTGMGNLSTRQVCSRETASLLAQAIVKLVGRKRTGRVILVGCQHIDLLIQFAQHGFVDVTASPCISRALGPTSGRCYVGFAFALPEYQSSLSSWIEEGRRAA